jgi:hypothetical protein
LKPKKPKAIPLSDDQVRQVILKYLYDRNRRSTSRRGKSTGAAATISVIRADLKATHGLSAQQIHSNLTYLLSQGWVEDQPVAKSFTTSRGGVVPSTTSYFIITAAGIDKISGPSEFTRNRFEGIRIEATGQNVITLGDGNQVNATFRELGEALSSLRREIKASHAIEDARKMELVVDVDTLQDQLARPTPNQVVVRSLWENINRAAAIAGLGTAVAQVAGLIAHLLK